MSEPTYTYKRIYIHNCIHYQILNIKIVYNLLQPLLLELSAFGYHFTCKLIYSAPYIYYSYVYVNLNCFPNAILFKALIGII